MNAQSICKALGDTGCYYLCLLKLVGRHDEAIMLYRQAVALGAIEPDCYVKNPALVLASASHGKWNVRHEGADYRCKNGEHEILRFERKTTTTTYAHFVVGDGSGHVLYDPLDNSATVAQGKLVSKRIVSSIA